MATPPLAAANGPGGTSNQADTAMSSLREAFLFGASRWGALRGQVAEGSGHCLQRGLEVPEEQREAECADDAECNVSCDPAAAVDAAAAGPYWPTTASAPAARGAAGAPSAPTVPEGDDDRHSHCQHHHCDHGVADGQPCVAERYVQDERRFRVHRPCPVSRAVSRSAERRVG